VIVERTGRSITEIFTDDGEAAFRALEEQLTAELLPLPGCCRSAAEQYSRPPRVTLFVVIECLVKGRSGSVSEAGRSRYRTPAAVGQCPRSAAEAPRRRAALYREVATEVIDTDHTTPPEVVRDDHECTCPQH
jgi:shikimate kinase